MKTLDQAESRLLVPKEQGRKTVLLLRWILIVVVGYLVVFSNLNRPPLSLPNLFFVFYVLSNLFLIVSPKRWFEKDLFIFLILLFDIGMSTVAIYVSARIDSEFYVIYFLILFIAALAQKAKFIYFSAALLLASYAGYAYYKNPYFFKDPLLLLRFSFLFVVSFFFNLMIQSYNRLRQEKEVLTENYRELEVLTELAQSIGRNKNIAEFLVRLNQTLCEKLLIDRCTSILVDKLGQKARICFSDEYPENDLVTIDLEKTPSFKESLHQNMEQPSEDLTPGGKVVSRYVLKEIPLFYQKENLGVLYLRINTPHRRLTRREEYFLSRLSEITASAIYNLEKSKD